MNNKNKNIVSLDIKFRNLKIALQQQNVKRIRFLADSINENDLASFVEHLSNDKQIYFIRALNNVKGSEVVNKLNTKTLSNIIKNFSKEETKNIIKPLYSDDVFELIEDLPSSLVTKVLAATSKEKRQNINFLLNYKEGTVGYEMNVDFISISINQNIQNLIDKIEKLHTKKNISNDIQFYYVVDEENILIGFVSDTNIYNAIDKSKSISTIVESDIVSVRASDDTSIAVEKFKKYHLTELPVCDSRNKLVGILTSQEALSLLEEEQSEDITKQAGVIYESDKKYFEIGIWKTFLNRIPWLLITLLISTFSQFFLSYFLNQQFSTNLDKEKWIIFVISSLPFILTIVGNIALQSTAIIIKGLISKEINYHYYSKVLKKEILVSALIFVSILILNFARLPFIEIIQNKINEITWKTFWWNFLKIHIIIFTSILLAIFFAISLPILATFIKLDPSLMSSPLLTTIIDFLVTGIAISISWSFT